MYIRMEGNNGGDFLEIESLYDNLVRLRVGHCCVTVDAEIVPVEILTAVLFQLLVGDWRVALDAISWPKDFKEQLKAQTADESRRQSDIEAADAANYKTGIGYT